MVKYPHHTEQYWRQRAEEYGQECLRRGQVPTLSGLSAKHGHYREFFSQTGRNLKRLVRDVWATQDPAPALQEWAAVYAQHCLDDGRRPSITGMCAYMGWRRSYLSEMPSLKAIVLATFRQEVDAHIRSVATQYARRSTAAGLRPTLNGLTDELGQCTAFFCNNPPLKAIALQAFAAASGEDVPPPPQVQCQGCMSLSRPGVLGPLPGRTTGQFCPDCQAEYQRVVQADGRVSA